MLREKFRPSSSCHRLLLLLVASSLAMSVEAFSPVGTSRIISPLIRFSPGQGKKQIGGLSLRASTTHRIFGPSSPIFPPKPRIPAHPSTALLSMSSSDLTPSPSSSSSSNNTRATAVYALMLCNLVVFLMDKVLGYHSFVSNQLYFVHGRRWKWWQPLTTCFCHADRFHLCNNLFLLLLFGRSVEDDQGWGGLLLSYVWCGVSASLVSLVLLPQHTVSIGASGAVFGLFAVSTLAKLSWRELEWRKLVEVAVLGEFVFRQLASELSTAAGGGRTGINHVAHLSGAAAGALLVLGMRLTVAKFDRVEEQTKKDRKKNPKKNENSK